VGGTATSGFRPCGVDRGASFLDVDDLAFLVDDERSPIGNSGLWDENTVRRGYFSIEEVAQQRERGVELGGKFFLRGSVICTDAKNFGFAAFEFCNTSLVCSDLARSATGKGGGKERQDHDILTAETGKGYLTALGRRQGEVGRQIAFFQLGVWRLNVLREETRSEQAGHQEK